jgi:uncharacterized protein
MPTSKIDIVKSYLDAARRQDFVAMQAYFTDDFVYRVPGKGPLSGVFKGRSAAIDYVVKIMGLTNGTYTILDFVDWLESEKSVALIARERITRHGEVFDWTRVVVFSFSGERFVGVALFDDDLYGLDALLLK